MGEMDKELPKIANIGWNNVKKRARICFNGLR